MSKIYARLEINYKTDVASFGEFIYVQHFRTKLYKILQTVRPQIAPSAGRWDEAMDQTLVTCYNSLSSIKYNTVSSHARESINKLHWVS